MSQPTTVRVRPAAPADVAEIAHIWHEGWADGHAGRVPEQLYRHRTAASCPPRVQQRLPTTWVLEVDGGVRGFVVVVDDEVEQVYVDAPARGTGEPGCCSPTPRARSRRPVIRARGSRSSGATPAHVRSTSVPGGSTSARWTTRSRRRPARSSCPAAATRRP